MRWLFGLLLLANLILFMWPSTEPPGDGSPASLPATEAGVPSLTLVGERRNLTAQPQAEPRAMAPEPEAGIAPQVQSAPQPAPEPVAEASPAPAPEPRPKSEPVAEPVADVAEPPEPEPTPAPIPALAAECVRFGPFAREDRARGAATYLADRRVYATLDAKGEARDARYIVYLPAAASRAAALERLRELQSKGIDSFIMGGELRNAISLGVFSQAESARRLMSQMEQRGYAAQMHSQGREAAVYWLDLGPKNSGRLSQDLAASLTQRYPETRWEARPCS